MNIQLQCCGLVIIALLIFFFFNQRRVGLFSEQIFLQTITLTGISLILDILSIVAITYMDSLPMILVKGICKAYFASLVMAAAQALFYVLVDMHDEKGYLRIIGYIRIVTLGQDLFVLLTPISIYRDGEVMYTYGPSVLLTYLFAVSYVIAVLVCAAVFRRMVVRNRRIAVCIWMTMWMGAAIVQFFNNQLLLVGFACALGMMVLYLKLENPESNMDRQFGCFHAHALTQYLDQCYEREARQSVFLVSLAGKKPDEAHGVSRAEGLELLTSYLARFPKAKVFKNNDPELVVLLPDADEMTRVYQQVRETFWPEQRKAGTQKDDKKGMYPFSFIALIPDILLLENTDEFYQMLQYLRAENRRKNRADIVYVDGTIFAAMRQRGEIKESVLNALDEDRVEVFYQPIYSTRQKRFVSAEALVRIRNTDGTIIPPGKFIPVAEETGIITQLGERVFEKVCEFLQNSNVEQLGISYIEVNLSVVQCEQKNLAERYITIMDKYKIRPCQINLEITESASVKTKEILLDNMKRLINYGVTFALDDFGIGQSNLDYVIEMPVSLMKFDMNMTQAYFRDLKAQFVVQAAIHMAHGMDLLLVAEGVETEEQLSGMKDENIDFIQGYYFSKPLPQQEFLKFLEASA